MYVKPALQRLGSFRELTQIGMNNSSDGASILGAVSPGSDRQWGDRFGPASEWENVLRQFPTAS